MDIPPAPHLDEGALLSRGRHMNRRTFFRNLIFGIAAVPAVIKTVGSTKILTFNPTDHMKVAPFKMEPGTIYFIPGVSGNYSTAPDWPPAQMEGDFEYTIVMKPAKSC